MLYWQSFAKILIVTLNAFYTTMCFTHEPGSSHEIYYMHRLNIAILLLFILTQSVIASEYYFQLHSGYSIKLKTPEQTTLEQAIYSSMPIEVTIISSGFQHQPFDQSTGMTIIQHLMPQILEQYEQPGYSVFSHTIQAIPNLQHQPDVATLPLPQLSTHSQEGKKQKDRHEKLEGEDEDEDEDDLLKIPCSYPECTELFPNRAKRTIHHKSHFTQEFFDSLKVNEKVACPVCGKIFQASLTTILIHMGKGGCKLK